MASKTWQKTFKWTVHYQEECLWSIFTSSIYCFQYRPKCRLPYLVVGCHLCPCNLLRANMNNTQLRYRVRIIWNGVNINTVLQNLVHTRPHWKSKLYFWMRPCKSSTRTINSDRLHITNQNSQAERILPSLLSPPTNSSTVSRYWFDDSNARKFIGYKKDLYDVNQQPIRYLAVPFTCPNALCNSSLPKRVIAWDPN